MAATKADAHKKVYLGKSYEKWKRLKETLQVKNDSQLAAALMERYVLNTIILRVAAFLD